MFARFAPTAPLSQRYVQQTAGRQLRRNLNSPPTPQVLNDFRLEQSGNRLRITDADGSVYVGAIESADTFGLAAPGGQETFQEGQAMRERQTAAGKPMAESERNAGTQGGYRFNAIGTNRSLGQKVVVAGRLVATNTQEMMSQTMQNVAAGANFAAAASNVQQQSLQQLLFNNFKVQGRVTIGGRTQLEFNAVPAGQ
jgi:hypothetical protein